MSKCLIAMSGGVDSAVCAYLMKYDGFSCIGATMKLLGGKNFLLDEEHKCCSKKDIEDARNVAASLSMEHYLFDFSEHFCQMVVDKFVDAYETGKTPNPCIECNRHLKFKRLFKEAENLGCSHIATGHYAKVCYDKEKGRYLLKKAEDLTKDQSYVLYSLSQEQLSHIYFPLGEMTKSEVRRIAEENGFVNAQKKESQDICFVKGEDYAEFIERYTGKAYPEGNFVDTNGNVLGTHKGIIHYTVGQRKGLGLSLPAPMYVKYIDADKNEVVLCRHEELFTKVLIAKDINFISVDNLYTPMKIKAKVRYRHAEQSATAVQLDSGTIRVEFNEPQRAITKGQAVVLYDGDMVVGGGTITETEI